MNVRAPVRDLPAVPPAPPAVKLAAYLVPLCVLPSAVWRIAVPVRQGNPAGCPASFMGAWEPVYIASLSVVSLGAALLTVGLVQRWGVVFPHWLPRLGGRTVPARPVIAVASAGAALIWSVYAWALLNGAFGWYQPAPATCVDPTEGPGGGAVAAAYAPMVLWAPLLTVVIIDYRRRRLAHRGRAASRGGPA